MHVAEYIAYTDGSCVNNRRNSKRARAGVGVWFGERHEQLNVSEPLRHTGPHTNQRAEIAACIRAIEQLEAQEEPFRLLIRTDSQYVIKAMTDWIKGWLKNGWRAYGGKPVQNRDLLEPLWCKVERHSVRFEHVRGHSGDYGNEMADYLACAGAGLERPMPGQAQSQHSAPCLDLDAIPSTPVSRPRSPAVFLF